MSAEAPHRVIPRVFRRVTVGVIITDAAAIAVVVIAVVIGGIR